MTYQLNFYSVIWCDSPRGLISFETWEGDSTLPLALSTHQVPKNIPLVEDEDELFDILRRKDGTKVCIPYTGLQTFLGWTI